MKILEAFNLTKYYGDVKALDNVSFSVPSNTIFGLLGPNGAGKTSFIRIANQIIKHTSGSLFFREKEITRKDLRSIGYLPEERGLYSKMNIGSQAVYLVSLKGISKSQANKSLRRLFDQFGIESWWDKKIGELSKGMQQLVQFIITIAHKPDLLILDEPLSGLDPIKSELLKKEIIDLKAKGTTIILSTHDMGSVEEICDEICLISEAKVVLQGNVDQLKTEFGENKFHISVENNSQLDNILSSHCLYNEICITQINGCSQIELDSKSTTNSILQLLTENQIMIESVIKIEPSMKDIFINQAKNN